MLQRKDGSIYHSEVVGKNIDIDGQSMVMGIVRDISHQVKIEQKIRTLSQAVEQSPVSVMILSIDGCIKYVNQAFENIVGYRFSEVEGSKFADLMPEHAMSESYPRLLEALSKGDSWEGEVLIRKKKRRDILGVWTYFPR